MEAATTAAHGADVGLEIDRARAENEAQLKAALTEDEYRSFQESEAMESSQQTVSTLLATLRSRGVTLDATQDDAVLRTYANTLREVATQAATTPIAGLTPEQLASLKQQQLQMFNEALMRRMSSVLNETQLKSFMEAQLEQQGGG